MSQFTYKLDKPNWFKRHRVERLKREIVLLEQFDQTLWRKMVACTFVTILGLAASLFGLAYLFHVQWGIAFAVPACLSAAALLYWASRYQYGLLWLCIAVVIGIICVLIFESGEIPDIPDLNVPDVGERKTNRKDERQAKIRRAIEKRKSRLEAALGKLRDA